MDWLKEYLGTLQLDPKEELQEIPNHSAFFILSPDNRCWEERYCNLGNFRKYHFSEN